LVLKINGNWISQWSSFYKCKGHNILEVDEGRMSLNAYFIEASVGLFESEGLNQDGAVTMH